MEQTPTSPPPPPSDQIRLYEHLLTIFRKDSEEYIYKISCFIQKNVPRESVEESIEDWYLRVKNRFRKK